MRGRTSDAGTTVNMIVPGVIETEMTFAILMERGAEILALTALRWIGRPDDIAGTVLFLDAADVGVWSGGPMSRTEEPPGASSRPINREPHLSSGLDLSAYAERTDRRPLSG